MRSIHVHGQPLENTAHRWKTRIQLSLKLRQEGMYLLSRICPSFFSDRYITSSCCRCKNLKFFLNIFTGLLFLFESVEREASGGLALLLRRTSLHHFTPYDRPLFRKTTTLLSRMGAFPLSPFSPSTCAFGCNLCAGESMGWVFNTIRCERDIFFSWLYKQT